MVNFREQGLGSITRLLQRCGSVVDASLERPVEQLNLVTRLRDFARVAEQGDDNAANDKNDYKPASGRGQSQPRRITRLLGDTGVQFLVGVPDDA